MVTQTETQTECTGISYSSNSIDKSNGGKNSNSSNSSNSTNL